MQCWTHELRGSVLGSGCSFPSMELTVTGSPETPDVCGSGAWVLQQSCQASLGPTKLCCLLCDFWQLHASTPQFSHLQNSSQTTGTLAAPREPLESKGPLVSPVSMLNSSVISRVNTQLVPIPFNRHTVQTQSVQESPNHTWVCTQNDENTRV